MNGCRQQGHVIRDCTQCMNLTISSKNKNGELTKYGLRRTYSKYGNISSARVNTNSYSAFACLSKRKQGETQIRDWENARELNEACNIEAYCGKRVKCYNCERNDHRASNCDRPTNAKTAGRRNLHQNKQDTPIPSDFFDQGSYTIECDRSTKGQHTSRIIRFI